MAEPQPVVNKPFIIRRNQGATLIPEDSRLFNANVEGKVRFVQRANAFVAIGKRTNHHHLTMC